MDIKQQCEIARLMTGFSTEDEDILLEVQKTHELVRIEASNLVDKLLKQHDQPFDKAYPIIKKDFLNIASRYEIGAPALFWIYMEWRSKK